MRNVIKGQIKELVRSSVEETLNGLLDEEAQKLTQTARYERSEGNDRATAEEGDCRRESRQKTPRGGNP